MPNLRLVIAQVLAAVTLALVVTTIIAGPEVMMATLAAAFRPTAMIAGLIGPVGLLVLSVAAFVLSRKRRSFLVAGLLAVSGIIFFLIPLTNTAHVTAMANSQHESYPRAAYIGLAILGLGVAKGIETRRMAAKIVVIGSIEIAPLQYHVYPPYGLVTEAFIPLGAYLLFVGIFISAKNISRDAEVRKEFYKNAESRLTLLKSIGVSQMEKELESQVKSVENRAKLLERTDEPDLEEEDIKEILHDVLTELYYSKGKKEIQKS